MCLFGGTGRWRGISAVVLFVPAGTNTHVSGGDFSASCCYFQNPNGKFAVFKIERWRPIEVSQKTSLIYVLSSVLECDVP